YSHKKIEEKNIKEQLETHGLKNLECNSISLLSNYVQNLPENEKLDADTSQKYEKKGCGKQISKKVWNLLEGYFLKDNINKSERHTAK
ncbi:19513_t:CDS:2, partial [Gigaspora margarita]